MADLAASDVTVAVVDRKIYAKQRRNVVTITFGDGVLTYPSGGVPLPAAASFGMVRNIDFIVITDANDAAGIVWKYDQANHKLRGYIQGAVISAAGSGTLDDHPLDGTADPLAAADRQPSNGAVSLGIIASAAGTVYLGAMKELLAAEHAPASQVLYAEAVGW